MEDHSNNTMATLAFDRNNRNHSVHGMRRPSDIHTITLLYKRTVHDSTNMYRSYDTACATKKSAQPALMEHLVFPLRSAKSQQPNGTTRFASIQDVRKRMRWVVELSDGA